VDTEQKRLITDEEVKKQLAAEALRAMVERTIRSLSIICRSDARSTHGPRNDLDAANAPSGYTDEDLKTILSPSALLGEERSLDGIDTPLACLSDNRNSCSIISSRPRTGHQSGDRFDPRGPGDSLNSYIGKRKETILDEAPKNCHTLKLRHPVIPIGGSKSCARELGRFPGRQSADAVPRERRRRPTEKAIETLCPQRFGRPSKSGYTLLMSVDRGRGRAVRADPSLLALSAGSQSPDS